MVSPLLGYRFLVTRVQVIFDFINTLYKIAPIQSERLIKYVLDSQLTDIFYRLVSEYDIKSEGGNKNKETDFKNLKKMSLKSCLSIFAEQKNTDLSKAKINCPLLLIYSSVDSFVGKSPKLLLNQNTTAKIIKNNDQHWNLMGAENREKIVNFLLYSNT